MIKQSEIVSEQRRFHMETVQATDYRKLIRTRKRRKTNEAESK